MSKREIVLVVEDVSEDSVLPRITCMQHAFLRVVEAHPGINANRAAGAIGCSYSTAFDSVRKFVRLGFVIRLENPYLRQSKGIPLFVTDSGRRHLKVLQEAGL